MARPKKACRLGDPLLSIRRFVGRLILIAAALSVAGLFAAFWIDETRVARRSLSDEPSERSETPPDELGNGVDWSAVFGISAVVVLVGAIPMLLCLWVILPRRITNAIYLRSFSHDRPTWPIRKAAQQALGRRFRLSGIRDPRRRRWAFDYLALAVFILRYGTPKFMNLEAGNDWKTRLWQSLGDVRCALIDISHLTPSVKEEIELCFNCLEPDRILFIGDATHTKDDWRRILAASFPERPEQIAAAGLALWDSSQRRGTRIFKDDVRAFASRVPKEPAGIKDVPRSLLQSGDWSSEPVPVHSVGDFLRGQFAVALLSLVVGAFLSSIAPIAGHAVTVAVYAVVAWYFLGYLIDATTRDRIVTTSCVVLLGLWYLNLLAAHAAAREAARRQLCSNNLKQIGLAFESYYDVHHQLPPACIVDVEGRPIHSWRVAILPYLGYQELYNRYRFDEPWDGPNNRQLAKEVPEIYRCPSDANLPVGCTNYFLVIGQDLTYEEVTDTTERMEERRRANYGRHLLGFDHAWHSTLSRRHFGRAFIVEQTGLDINWLEPRDLAGDVLSNPINNGHEHSLSSPHGGGVNCLLDGGISEFIPQDTDVTKVREYFTKARTFDD
jgi:hypothetical protein